MTDRRPDLPLHNRHTFGACLALIDLQAFPIPSLTPAIFLVAVIWSDCNKSFFDRTLVGYGDRNSCSYQHQAHHEMSNSSRNYHTDFEPVSPIDIVENAQRRSRAVGFDNDSFDDEKKQYATVTTRSRQSSSSSGASLKTPRTARFAEATSVHSPIDGRSPFADPPNMAESEKTAKVSDLGFGYINDNASEVPVHQEATVRDYYGNSGPMSPPLKSALKTPGTPGRHLNPLSPTFREEQMLEKEEEKTEAQNAQDLVSLIEDRWYRTTSLTMFPSTRKSRCVCAWPRWFSVVSTFPAL